MLYGLLFFDVWLIPTGLSIVVVIGCLVAFFLAKSRSQPRNKPPSIRVDSFPPFVSKAPPIGTNLTVILKAGAPRRVEKDTADEKSLLDERLGSRRPHRSDSFTEEINEQKLRDTIERLQRLQKEEKAGNFDESQAPLNSGKMIDFVTGDFTAVFNKLRDDASHSIVRVFYATDRNTVDGTPDHVQYGPHRSPSGKLSFGKCEVSIPKRHKVGRLESPSFLRLEFKADPEKHIVLLHCVSLDRDVFWGEMAESVARSTAKDLLIFVHGYNVSFENAARRTGQVAFDLNFLGAPVFYSWPSNGAVQDYMKDETNVAWSVPHFQQFLDLVILNSQAERIHIIAHSMGNRLVCEALKAHGYRLPASVHIDHLVLAAPDIDAETFKELAAILQKLTRRITLYESTNDKALRASRLVHGYPRAGEPILVIPGLDAIDASAIDTDFLGHSYFSDNWPLLSDIYSLLSKDDPPSTRFGLSAMQHTDGTYYAFKA